MAVNLCGCTAPRCMTPSEPIIKRAFRGGSKQISTIPENVTGTDSKYTSTRSEDLREIRELFNQDNCLSSSSEPAEDKPCDSSTVSSKHSKIAIFFRRRLSRTFSKSKLDKPDPEKLKEAKNEIKSNLLNDKGPDAGGYDADAAELENVDEAVTSPEQPVEDSSRGRTKVRRHSLPFSTWSGPEGHARLSIDFSPPRLSFGSHGYHRHSRSMYSLGSGRESPEFAIRLPSFAVDRDTSHTWKKGVMESLQINSPSTSALVATPVRRSPLRRSTAREKSERSLIQWPLRENVLTPDSFEPLIQSSPIREVAAHDGGNVLLMSARPSADIDYLTASGPAFEHLSPPSHMGSSSSSNGGRPHFFMRPERKPARSSNASVHLYNMGISRHLRSTSMSSAGAYSKPTTRAPTAAQTRTHTPSANTRESSKVHLVVEDLPPLPPSATKTRASSEYSLHASRENSPIMRATPSIQKVAKSPSAKRLSTASKMSNARPTSSRSLQAPGALPDDNQSTSNLSQNSNHSSKVSRFKEEFESPNKKSKKRTSIANLFNQLAANAKQPRRRRTGSISSFDGAIDEPKRLQRALQLTEQKDAAGLLVKAIRDKQAEKSALYLKGNKEAAQREVFRQRSSSFCRPRGDSLAKEENGIQWQDWHRRSTSETFLKPDASLPTLQPPGLVAEAIPRAHSTGHLTPEFRTPVFSGSPFLTPEGPAPPPRRKLSVGISPTAVGPSEIPRRPSFQLNDMPAVLETPKDSIAKGKRKSVSVSFIRPRPTTADTDDSEVDLGAWSRYPSHTREARTGSAGMRDNVKTRDFAYDFNPANITAESSDNEGEASKSKKRGKKKKKRTGALPKSRSMMFGGLRNYARTFMRSSSAEYLNYGKGHRSSISAGGHLEHPELELLPPVFAPMPTIPAEEDPALAAGRYEIELKNIKHRRNDHGHSFAEPSHSGPSRPHPARPAPAHVDGSTDAEKVVARPEEARRVASSPALVGHGAIMAADGTPIKNALAYARHYESCVYLPPSTSHSTVSRSNINFNMLHETSYSRMTNHSPPQSAPHSPAESNLIDKMLASQPPSTNVSPLPSPLLGPVQMPSIGEVADGKKSKHGQSKSVSSVTSLRASSMDLLRTLKEAEERERKRAFEDLLSRARSSFSEESRKPSTEGHVRTLEAEKAEPTMEQYNVPGHLGTAHQTWPGAYRGSSSVEAS